MKILLVSEFFPDLKNLSFSGGVEAREYFVAKELSKNHKVVVLTSNLGGKRVERLGNLEVIKVGKKRSYRAVTGNVGERLLFIRQAINLGLEIESDLVEGSNFITHFIASGIARTKRIPSVAWYPEVWIGQWIKNTGLVGLTGEILERVNLRRDFGAFIAISKETGKKLSEFTGKKVYVIPCGIDRDEFKEREKKAKERIIISIGRLSVNKNHRVIIDAFSKLDGDNRLIIVGSGPLKKQLESQVRQLGLTGRVKFLENISRIELLFLLKSAWVFTLASKLEGFGISTIEAAAAGVPFVVSDIEVHKEVTKNGQGGFLVKVGDSDGFARKIDQLLKDKKLYQRKSAEGKILAKNYRWDRIAKETEKVYRSLL